MESKASEVLRPFTFSYSSRIRISKSQSDFAVGDFSQMKFEHGHRLALGSEGQPDYGARPLWTWLARRHRLHCDLRGAALQPIELRINERMKLVREGGRATSGRLAAYRPSDARNARSTPTIGHAVELGQPIRRAETSISKDSISKGEREKAYGKYGTWCFLGRAH